MILKVKIKWIEYFIKIREKILVRDLIKIEKGIFNMIFKVIRSKIRNKGLKKYSSI